MSDTTTLTTYLTIPEVAAALSCSRDTVRRLIARGEIRAVRFGRLIRVAASEVSRGGRPVRRVEVAAPTADQRVASGRRPSETWQQWSARRAAG